MPETPWYQNKSTLAHIFTALVGTATSVAGILTSDFHHSIPGWIVKGGSILLMLASAMGVYDNHA